MDTIGVTTIVTGKIVGAYGVMQNRATLGAGKPGLCEFARVLLTNGQLVFSHVSLDLKLVELTPGSALTRWYWWRRRTTFAGEQSLHGSNT